MALVFLAIAACSTPNESDDSTPDTSSDSTPDDSNETSPDRPESLEIVARSDWQPFFDAQELTGTFVLHEVGSDQIQVFDEERANEPLTPASTFKILNSMIILETNTIESVDTVIPWDGVDRGSSGWNRDHSLRSAIEVSAVWVYQDLARRVGPDQMQEWVAAADYGNREASGSIDRFWLDGDLRIGAVEQVDFLARFVNGDLPFEPTTLEEVREILERESGPRWVWSHKTGLSDAADPDLGWFVGVVDRDGTSWVFALNVDLEADGMPLDPALRELVARQILESEGVLPTL